MYKMIHFAFTLKNIVLFLYNSEIRIRFWSPVKRVKRLNNYLSFYGELLVWYHRKGKYKMDNYHFNGINLMRILSSVVFMRMFKIGIC